MVTAIRLGHGEQDGPELEAALDRLAVVEDEDGPAARPAWIEQLTADG